MAIKYLRGIYNLSNIKTTRPLPNFRFPVGIKTGVGNMDEARGSDPSSAAGTFDLLMVAGGGPSGTRLGGGSPESCVSNPGSGAGGAGGVRIFSANNLTELTQYKNLCNLSPTGDNFIPVVIGGNGTDSCFGNLFNCRGGGGGTGGDRWAPAGYNAGDGGSGGGGNKAGRANGNGIAGQGCPGGSGNGGSATAAGSTSGGLTTSFTGTSIQFGNGGCTNNDTAGAANRGNGGGGANPTAGFGYRPAISKPGGSGLVAIRYRNPAGVSTPLATGGNSVCCTGGCIIHVFESSGLFNVSTQFSIN